MSVLLTRRQSASPSTLQPLTEPIANDLMTMIHEQHPHQTVTFDHLAVPAEQHSSHQPKQHAQSDCGHDSPPNHSLLRHFSLRSRNSFSLRKSRHQNRVLPPPPLLALEPYSKPEKVRTDSGSTASQSHSTNGSSLSLWKKWRVRSVSEYSSRNTSALGLVEHEEGPVTGYHNATSTHQAPVRKRSLFLPFVTVTRLIAPFQFSSSEAEDSSVGISQSQQSVHNQDGKKVNEIGNGNASRDEDQIGLIRQVDGWVEVETQARMPMPHPKSDLDTNRSLLPPSSPPLPPLPATSLTLPSSPPLPLLPLPSSPSLNSPTSSKRHLGCERDLDPDVDLSLLALLVEFDGDVSDIGLGQDAEQDSQMPSIVKEDLSCTPVDALDPTIGAPGPPPSSSTSTPKSTPFHSNPQPSSNNLNPSLKPSISQKRRAKFTLGDEWDLDLSASVSEVAVAAARGEGARALSSSGSTPVYTVVPSIKSTTTTDMDIHRPPLTRRERLVDKTRDQNVITTSSSSTGTEPGTKTSTANCKNTRRWTLSSALTDEGISDEGLIKELERMREILEWDCTPIDMDGHDTSFVPSPLTRLPSPSNSSPTWLTTQRALLTTRELILTERHYLSSLLLLLCPDSTLTPVPEMMVSCVKELVGVSERLLKGMEKEPSVRGVAEVFVEIGEDVVGEGGQVDGDGDKGAERAFVGWCGVVGGWFQDDLAVSGDTQAVVGVKRRRKRLEGGVGVGGIGGEEHYLTSDHEGSSSGLGVTSSASSSPTTTTEHGHTSPLMRTVSTLRMSMPSIAGLGEGGVWRRDRDKDRERNKDEGDRGRLSPTSFTTGAIGSSSSNSMTSSSSSKPIRKPSVRDLAILPTQRVMRYVLLYRDLLANTPPSSSSYPIVERAVEVACRIAEKCDRAQGNAAFIAGGSAAAPGSSSSGSSNSMLNDGSNDRRSRSKRTTLPETNPKLKTVRGSTAYATSSGSTTSNSVTSSPTESHFASSSSPYQSHSKLPSTSISHSLPSNSTPTPLSLPAKPIPPPPPSSFHSKIPVAKSGQSLGSLSTPSAGSSSDTTTTTTTTTTTSSSSSSPSSSPFSSLPSSSASSALFLPKSASSSFSRMPKSLSAVSLMSLVNGLGRSVSGPAGVVADSGPASVCASASPTKIQV